jgi:zinc transport system substrate-binding protein
MSLTSRRILMKMVLMSVSVRRLSLLGCLLVLLAVTGCATAGSASSTRTHGELTIVTAFYPLQFVAQRVAGAHGAITDLTQPGAEPHDLELTPRQVASLTTASLVIYERGFQPAVDEAV